MRFNDALLEDGRGADSLVEIAQERPPSRPGVVHVAPASQRSAWAHGASSSARLMARWEAVLK